MTVVVTGSVATDHLMSFPGTIREQILTDQLDRISLSFLVEDLQVRRGGVAANICFGLGTLGLSPVLVAAVGADFEDYRRWLTGHGVDTDHVLVCDDLHTARFVCTTDGEQNQIASFYPGAMSRARDIDLAEVIADRGDDVELVVISPDDPEAMLRHTATCRARGIPFAADPSQQIAVLDGDALRALVDGARYLLTNDYERALLQKKTGWHDSEIAERVGCWVTTHGADGVTAEESGHDRIQVPSVPADVVVDPTGVGDAFRSGFIAAVTGGLSPERAAMTGAAIATTVLETTGTQEHTLDRPRLLSRVRTTYGADAATDISRLLPATDAPLSLEDAR